ncbi:pantetheine-phosphate adenylyltransferase [Salegentibacter mishustinae]|uniref:Phosphopantetheine adenylyltransferase n=1 Tax=Salegentibacter mishustinae TaxID=270918 RepID=A0A0Q9ZBH1_9FLAO|nr:pantetheine-phosphate adenylyltransferase [Salegentibacter mishustinae]KRG30380.1 phosphopantetheine adenylyltransferase [Salegentibacter mishustinae]PNW23276.1 phosphopantetheine adenylyltransferase [Salegentibacter mishustinae]PZX66337.1 phosphopantetheine adenylyltransferase [Salegentibacter mishustinae]GGW81947.1 phosphopantetheine adenylyltransferase [Salegentibacter mishustinae]
MRKAVFPGSFDPITLGHTDIIERALPLFDEIILAIGTNSNKNYMFSLEERLRFLRETFKNEPKITVTTYQGLTVDFCKEQNAGFLLRGLRNAQDLEFEKAIGQTNYKMSGIDTLFFITSSGKSHISSTVVRDVIRNNGNYEFMVPDVVRKAP